MMAQELAGSAGGPAAPLQPPRQQQRQDQLSPWPLPINNQLYEREAHISKLRQVKAKLCQEDCPSQICLVHGLSGSGKTSLCNQFLLEEPQQTDNQQPLCWFVKGKSDQFQDLFSEPYAAIVQAFDSLVEKLIQLLHQPQPSDDNKELLQALQSCLALEGSILIKLIPRFQQLLPKQGSSNQSSPQKEEEGHHEQHDQNEQDTAGWSGSVEAADSGAHNSNPGRYSDLQLAPERLSVAFRSILRLICTRARPLILFLDDLQWADPNSFAVLLAIVQDPDTKHFLFLGGYREEQAQRIQDDFLKPFQQQHAVLNADNDFTNIHVDNLQLVTNVEAMIQDKYHLKNQNSKDLSELSTLIHSKTNGNPYFVHQILRQIIRCQSKSMNAQKLQGQAQQQQEQVELDTEKAKADIMEMADNLVTLLQTTQLLCPDAQRILGLAACIGYAVDTDLLFYLDSMEMIHIANTRQHESAPSPPTPANNTYFWEALVSAEKEELIVLRDSATKGNINTSDYKYVKSSNDSGKKNNCVVQFQHDRVQQCFYELLGGEASRASLQLRVGLSTLQAYEDEGKLRKSPLSAEVQNISDPVKSPHLRMQRNDNNPRLMLLAADQCNRGSNAIEDEIVRLRVIRLNLQASREARTKAGATLVANFLDKAISLIRDSDWKDDFLYDLVLEIHNFSAEVEATQGRFEKSAERVETILLWARNPQDTVRAIAARVLSLGARFQFVAALAEARKALVLLGFQVPPSNKSSLIYESWKTRRMVKNKTESDFLNLPRMKNARMELAMKILKMTALWGWQCDIYFASISKLIMMRVTLKHGLCSLAPFAFSSYGNSMAVFENNLDAAYSFGQVALKLDVGREAVPATTMMTHTYLSHLRLPASSSLEPFLSAYRVSIETGDLLLGVICLCNYQSLGMFCGLPLGPYITDMQKYFEEVKLCKKTALLAFVLPDYLLALNLTGKTEDPSLISWEAIKEAHLSQENQQVAKQHPADLNLQYKQMFNAIVLGDCDKMELALRNVLTRTKKSRKYDGMHVFNVFFTFLDGLAGIELLRSMNKEKKRRNPTKRQCTRVVQESICWLTRLSRQGAINCVGILHLLKAEKASLRYNANIQATRKLYDVAISQLSKTGFNHFAALANERAGTYMLENRDQSWAQHYLSRAVKRYQEWGASVKVDSLINLHPFIQLEDGSSNEVQLLIRGRSRFDTRRDSIRLVTQERSSQFSSQFLSVDSNSSS